MSITTIPQLFFDAVTNRPRPDMFSHKDASGSYVDVSSADIQRRVRALRLGLDPWAWAAATAWRFSQRTAWSGP